MNRVFVDTSALMAVAVASDQAHDRGRAGLERLRSLQAILITTSYVLTETYALLGHRHGPAAIRSFREQFAPLLDVVWVDAGLHERGLDRLLEHDERHLSLVDVVSLEVMRDEGVDHVFAFDPHLLRDGAQQVA